MTVTTLSNTRRSVRTLPPLDAGAIPRSPFEIVSDDKHLDPMPLEPRFLPFHLDPRGGFLPLAPSRRKRRK